MQQTIDSVRQQARHRFDAHGYPGKKLEAWRHLNLRPLKGFSVDGVPVPNADLLKRTRQLLPPPTEQDVTRIVLVDGQWVPELSDTVSTNGQQGLQISSLDQCTPAEQERFLGRLDTIASNESASFQWLNTSHLAGEVVISCLGKTRIVKPVELIHVSTHDASVVHPRVFVSAGPLTELTLVERFIGAEGRSTFSNAVTEIDMAQGARVKHIRILDEQEDGFHVGAVAADLSRDAYFESYVLSLGGKLARTDVRVRLSEPGARCSLNGLYVASGEQTHDHYTVVEHEASQTSSDEHYKGIVGGRGRGGFFGRVLIQPGSMGCEAHQLNHNLLLSENGKVHSRPQLEIDNDDVVASHGTTVGQLDEQALFYLQSRGLNRSLARCLLIWAFAEEVIAKAQWPQLQVLLHDALVSRLGLADTDFHAVWSQQDND